MRKLKTMDGNEAAAHVAYAFSEVAAIYPITPSSVMAEHADVWASNDKKNIFGQPVNIVEMQSEGGAAGAFHGSLSTGALTSTFTASQGLLLMIPNLYKVAGEMLPGVIHVAARSLASHALSIFGDHSDVMSCRSTGFAMLASGSPQEVMDLAAVAHLSAIKGSLPVMHFFDGFRTSHEIQKVETWDYEDLKEMVDWDAIKRFRANANNPAHPFSRGSSEAPEIFFQHREACNLNYERMVDVVESAMEQVNAKCGTNYKPFNYYGAPDAEGVIIAMGSVCGTAEETVDYLNAIGRKVGIVTVRLYRPFSAKHFLSVLPETVKRIAVLDRTKEPGAPGEPLYLDVASTIAVSDRAGIKVIGGRYGLSSKDTTPDDILAVFDNLCADEPKRGFTVSINDDVTHLSLETKPLSVPREDSTVACKFWGLGADGLVGACKNTIKIIGDHTDKKVQAYFQYDSKKSGGLTISHLRFGDNKIRSAYYVGNADFVACGNPAYIGRYDMVQDVKPGGIFLLNCPWEGGELDQHLPADVKRYIAQNNVRFYTCDAAGLARAIKLKGRINTIIQSAFFSLTNIIPMDDAVKYMEDSIVKTYGRKGEAVVKMNLDAVQAGKSGYKLVEVPASWAEACDECSTAEVFCGRDDAQTDYLNNIFSPSNHLRGDKIPVSRFVRTVGGEIPAGTAAFEKRRIAAEVPQWDAERCIQCHWCSTVCPHAVIRPFVLNDETAEACGSKTIALKGDEEKRFIISISAADCTGCGSCVEMCMAREKALKLVPAESVVDEQQKVFDYVKAKALEYNVEADNIRNSQFLQPLLEYSGACPGCGETPYAKLVTQLYGSRMFIANATGCSSIWGCSAPSTPYTVDKKGRGPAWANSLFEDNAEYGYGMAISMRTRRAQMRTAVERLSEDEKFKAAASKWLDAMETPAAEQAGQELVELCRASTCNADAAFVVENTDLIAKPSIWIFGGDGWAYDIGYGGLDHVLASTENVNVLVFDTEVYSNTGGQSSKATPPGAVAQFAAAGKSTSKKDLAQIAMTYGHVYVAQVAIGANPAQTLKAIREAESYDGPSLIIAYAPCINHGIRAGMNQSMPEMKKAVRAGYWNLLRFDPRLVKEGRNPLSIDSSRPTEDYGKFLRGEVRYSSLELKHPERAEKLFAQAEADALNRYESLLGRKASLEPKK